MSPVVATCTPLPDVTDDEILAKLPPHGTLGLWTHGLADTFNLARTHHPITTRLVYRALVRLEKRGLASREGRTASRLYIGWVRAQPQQ